ncbi:MAG: GreA/GreB family elongation factor [Pseudomonas sp.]
MSRAFVNVDQAAAQASQPVERLISEQPNYLTAQGLEQLKGRIDALERARSALNGTGAEADPQALADLERDLRYYRQRLQSAQPVPPATSREQVQIGSWVTFADADDRRQRIQLVGEDEADAGAGKINWGSPLGQALLGAKLGDERLWKRPMGDVLIEVIEVSP